jgi:toxin ParE1/3/4
VNVEWTPVARRDRRGQLDYMKHLNPAVAIDMADGIETAVAYIAAQPAMGRPGRKRGTREWRVSGTPYLLIYRLDEHSLVILRLLHGAQDWPAR